MPDGFYTDLPDFATVSFSPDWLFPAIAAGIGPGASVAYTVDRYGNAYFTLGGSLGASLGPLSIGYSEGYMNRISGANYMPSEGELKQGISNVSLGVNANALIFGGGGEFNLDQTIDDYVFVTIGYVLGQYAISAELSFTILLPREVSVNPQGWYRVEELQRYYFHDVW
ncbi:MAG: hypothetical protein U9R05_00400 [Chloroflexota bacterium]|nr:hypothetical protein [Chloroflexota bacterium]